VQPRTIARVLSLPSLLLPLVEAPFAVVGNIAAELDVALGVVEGLDVGDADVVEVLLEVEELDDVVLDAVVEAVVDASTEVTTV